jgi:glycosyltransferase involved in cell wall biosynthesis
MRPRILLIADWYLPGYKAGGIITALANLVDGVGDEFDLRVVTRDRDLTDSEPYAGVVAGEWQAIGKARVLYIHDFSLAHLRHRIAGTQPDIVYLNSFFSRLTAKTLALRRLGLLPPAAFAVAPRGEFSPSALRIKRRKKSIYAAAALRAGLYDGILWHATSSPEGAAIESFLRMHARQNPRIGISPDLPNRDWFAHGVNADDRAPKSSPVKFLFLSRIGPMKNLQFALDALASLSAPAELHIYGPIDDPAYWDECQRRIAALPQNVRATYHGAVAREHVPQIFREHDFLLLPTEGENFGYVLLESLAAGCPVIVSDRTPWRDLHEKGVGWAIPLEDRASWCQTLASCAEMDSPTLAAMSLCAREYVQAWLAQSDPRRATIEMFQSLVEKHALSEPARAVPAAVVAGATRSKSI